MCFFFTFVWAQRRIWVEKLKEIVQGCIKNDRNKQSELYQVFSAKMYGICLRYSANADDAQDLLQEGFVKVFESIRHFKWKGSLEGWMRRVFVNLALDKYRSRITHLSVDELGDAQDITDQEASALDHMSEKEIMQLVQQLPDQYRMVFNLYVVEGHSHHEIAQALQIGVSTSRSNLARAKVLLKEKIECNTRCVAKAIHQNG